MIRGHHFHRSPLSQVVPLEGSDTVLGLRQIDSLSRSENLKRSLGVTGGKHLVLKTFHHCVVNIVFSRMYRHLLYLPGRCAAAVLAL